MKKLFIAALAFAPALASAQTLTNVGTLLRSIGSLVSTALPILVGLALLGFFWGLAKFLLGGAEGKEEGRSIMIYGVITLFVMVAVWGLVGFLGNALGINSTQNNVTTPTVNGLPPAY